MLIKFEVHKFFYKIINTNTYEDITRILDATHFGLKYNFIEIGFIDRFIRTDSHISHLKNLINSLLFWCLI